MFACLLVFGLVGGKERREEDSGREMDASRRVESSFSH